MRIDWLKIINFVMGVIKLGHEQGLWDQNHAMTPGTPDHGKLLAVVTGTEGLFVGDGPPTVTTTTTTTA